MPLDSSWIESDLWLLLIAKDSPTAREVAAAITTVLSDVETILSSAGTSPPDFSLHDNQHSFRVAQNASLIMPAETRDALTEYELALMLLAAYLHDIGMTPHQGRVQSHRTYLLTGDSQSLEPSDLQHLHTWLDSLSQTYFPPPAEVTPTVVATVNTLLAQYCRLRHADWSDEWMVANLPSVPLATYTGWQDDLRLLCRSHSGGIDGLRSPAMNPRLVGTPPLVVNLRYLAALLRVADVLDLHPGRTPDVILRHREVHPSSLPYWYKDHDISWTIDEDKLVFYARPRRAHIQRAILETIDQIDHELGICATLASEIHFDLCPGISEPTGHRWRLAAKVHQDVRPHLSSYEYIDGTFRPDTPRLLELLSGVELYGDPIASVRELLHNAFDAVLEQIAYSRLRQPAPEDPSLERALGDLEHVTLSFETRGDDYWLTCADTGVGMTKAIIENSLLVSGKPQRPQLLELERHCLTKGFALGRTGQFGIGVLSYFMIADLVVITTRRSHDPGDADGATWRFETSGLASFGELRRLSEPLRGSLVELRLKRGIFDGEPRRWYDSLIRYLQTEFAYVPCRLLVTTNLDNCPELAMSTGWTRQADYFTDLALSQLSQARYSYDLPERLPEELLPAARREQFSQFDRHWQDIRLEAEATIKWEVEEGLLPDSLARFRVHIPHFSLPGGDSLAFVRSFQEGTSLRLRRLWKGLLFAPRGSCLMSWKGASVRIEPRRRRRPYLDLLTDVSDIPTAFVEIDWVRSDCGSISVSRHALALNDASFQQLTQVKQAARALTRTALRQADESAFRLINYGIADEDPPSFLQVKWIHITAESEDEPLDWTELQYPLIDSSPYRYLPIPKLTWRDMSVFVACSLPSPDTNNHDDGLPWHSQRVAPDRIVIYPSYRFGLTAMWTDPPSGRSPLPGHIPSCDFPSQWPDLAAVRLHPGNRYASTFIWNSAHPIVRHLDQAGWNWHTSVALSSQDPLTYANQVVESPGRCAAWLVALARIGKRDLWEGLAERQPALSFSVWEQLGLTTPATSNSTYRPVQIWIDDPIHPYLLTVDPTTWNYQDMSSSRNSPFVDPSDDWTLKQIAPPRRRRHR